MTNSSDNTHTPQAPASKPKKKKGPIRFEAILPFGIFVLAVALYFKLFFDHHLRKGLEWGLTTANGAEVNIGDVRTRFFSLSFNIDKTQFTDPAAPKRNRLEIGSVEWKMLWDALLRGKGVIELAAVRKIEIGTPRKTAGKVLPPEENSDSQWKETLLAKANELSGGMLNEISELLEGFDPKEKLKELSDTLQSSLKIKEISAKIQEQEKLVNAAIAAIPGDQDFQRIASKVDSISKGLSKNPIEAKNQIQEMRNLINDAKSKVDQVQAAAAKVTDQVQSIQSSVTQVDDAIKADRKNLESKLQLPKLDSKELANQLFGNQIMAKATEVRRYAELAKKYMPPPSKDKEIKAEIKRRRGEGKTYDFGRPNGYPLFWLKRMEISSTGAHSAAGGDVEGVLTHVSTNQRATGQPTQLKVKGSFPEQRVDGVELLAAYDSRQAPSTSSIQMKVASFPIGERTLAHTDAIKLAILDAVGSASLEAKIHGNELELGIEGLFRELKPQIEAKSSKFQGILRDVFSEMKSLSLKASAKGVIPKFALSIESNLASQLEAGLKRALQAKIAEARAQIEALVDGKVKAERDKLQKQAKAIQDRAMGIVNEKKKKAEELRNLAQAKVDDAERRLIQQAAPVNKIQDVKKKIFGR